MASRKAQSASMGSDLQRRVNDRFGVLPNFFMLSPETPEITEKLWGFAQAAYLDNPLPSLFKERLFVHLSRFCAARYCIARHVGFLVGLAGPLAMRLYERKVSQMLLNSFNGLFHADKNFSPVSHCAQPAPHPLSK